MLCFCEACPPSKKEKQRQFEIRLQQQGLGHVLEDGTVVHNDPFPAVESESSDDGQADEV